MGISSHNMIKISDTVAPRCGCRAPHPEVIAGRLVPQLPTLLYECPTCGAAWEWGYPCAVPRMPKTYAELLRMSDEELRRAVADETGLTPESIDPPDATTEDKTHG